MDSFRNCLGQQLALSLYRTFVLPHNDYCVTIYMCTNRETWNSLQLVQNVGCRTILLACKRTSIKEMHQQLDLLSLEYRPNIQLSQLCHKNIFPDRPQSLTKYFIPARIIGGRRTRAVDNNNMTVPNVKTEKGRQAFMYWGRTHWNKLDNYLKVIEKYVTFQRELLKRTITWQSPYIVTSSQSLNRFNVSSLWGSWGPVWALWAGAWGDGICVCDHLW